MQGDSLLDLHVSRQSLDMTFQGWWGWEPFTRLLVDDKTKSTPDAQHPASRSPGGELRTPGMAVSSYSSSSGRIWWLAVLNLFGMYLSEAGLEPLHELRSHNDTLSARLGPKLSSFRSSAGPTRRVLPWVPQNGPASTT